MVVSIEEFQFMLDAWERAEKESTITDSSVRRMAVIGIYDGKHIVIHPGGFKQVKPAPQTTEEYLNSFDAE